MLNRIENLGDAWGIQKMQEKRIKQYPFSIEGSYVIDSDFEGKGTLRIYENIGDTFVMQNALDHLCAEAVINDLWENNRTDLFLHKLFCCYGFENIAPEMADQVIAFAKFYQYERIGMSRILYQEWKDVIDIFSGFRQNEHGVYVLELSYVGGLPNEK